MGGLGQLLRRQRRLARCRTGRGAARAAETTFPDLGQNTLTRNRHGDRLSLLQPEPQGISRRLFTRKQSNPDACQAGYGAAVPAQSNCDYQKAPFFNVLAAFWIQFMTHDWFSHLEEGHNDSEYENAGCATERVNNVVRPLTAEEIQRLGSGARRVLQSRLDAASRCGNGRRVSAVISSSGNITQRRPTR
jgi:hypothetical protein